MPVYIGKSGDLVRCYRCLTNRQTTEDRATQLLYSIQFKLSHAIKDIIFVAIAAFLFQTNTVCHQNITTFMGLSHLTNCINKSQNTKWWWYKLACLISSCKRTVEGKFQDRKKGPRSWLIWVSISWVIKGDQNFIKEVLLELLWWEQPFLANAILNEILENWFSRQK